MNEKRWKTRKKKGKNEWKKSHKNHLLTGKCDIINNKKKEKVKKI